MTCIGELSISWCLWEFVGLQVFLYTLSVRWHLRVPQIRVVIRDGDFADIFPLASFLPWTFPGSNASSVNLSSRLPGVWGRASGACWWHGCPAQASVGGDVGRSERRANVSADAVSS
jgi:hypothetical protein